MAFQPQPLFEDAISSGSIDAVDESIILSLNNSSGAIISVSGTWVGTIVLEGTNDDFLTVQNAAVFTPALGVITSGITANGYYRLVAVSGFTKIRARMSAYTSGSATIVLSASIGAGLAPTVSVNYASMLGTSKIIGSDGATIADVVNHSGQNRVQVGAAITNLPSAMVQSWNSTLKYLDMNVSNGGVARGTAITSAAYTTIFSYSGSGYIAGFIINIETFSDWLIRFLVDGQDVFIGSAGIPSSEIQSDSVYDTDDIADVNQSFLGISKGSHDRVVFSSPLSIPIYYSSSVSIQLKRVTSNKNFQAGLMIMSKIT